MSYLKFYFSHVTLTSAKMSGDKLKALVTGTLFGIGFAVGCSLVRVARIALGVPFIMDTKEGVRMALANDVNPPVAVDPNKSNQSL